MRLPRWAFSRSMIVELETTGAKSGQPRRVPLTGRADDKGVWVISQHGRRAGWAHNIAADPRVRVRVANQWRTGTATFEPNDDVRARARSFGGGGKVSQSVTALTMRAMESDPISVRIERPTDAVGRVNQAASCSTAQRRPGSRR